MLSIQLRHIDGWQAAIGLGARVKQWIAQHAHPVLTIRVHIMT